MNRPSTLVPLKLPMHTPQLTGESEWLRGLVFIASWYRSRLVPKDLLPKGARLWRGKKKQATKTQRKNIPERSKKAPQKNKKKTVGGPPKQLVACGERAETLERTAGGATSFPGFVCFCVFLALDAFRV